jgi:hypothetical protein
VPGEDNAADYRSILERVAAVTGSCTAYVTCDEASLSSPKSEIVEFAHDLGLSLIWKSDAVGKEPAFNWAVASEVDFQIALAADIFFGSTRSTFANLLCSAKTAEKGYSHHYVYNAQGAAVLRTDAGAFSSVREVTNIQAEPTLSRV